MRTLEPIPRGLFFYSTPACLRNVFADLYYNNLAILRLSLITICECDFLSSTSSKGTLLLDTK